MGLNVVKVFSVLFLVMAFIIGGCDSTGDTGDAQPPLIRVGHVGHDHQLALYAAALAGPKLTEFGTVHLRQIQPREVYDLVEDNRVVARLQFIKVGGGSAMPAAMGRGEIDFGLGGLMPVAKIVDGGADIKVIAPLQTDGDMLIMNNSFTGSSWADFVEHVKNSDRPVRMGYKAPIAMAKLIFERALKHDGIFYSYDQSSQPGSVLLINMSRETGYIPLLERGDIDGLVMNQPAAAFAEVKGVGKIVCDLCDLPPAGKWKNHPCCCAVATGKMLETHPDAVKAFVELLTASSKMINSDTRQAIEYAVQWTNNDIEIEKLSIPTIGYVDTDIEGWLGGVQTWLEMVDGLKLFNGKYATQSNDYIIKDLCDLQYCEQPAK